MAVFLYRLGHFSVRRRRWVLAFWILLFVAAGTASSLAGGKTSETFTLPGTESQQAADLLAKRFPTQGGSSTQVVFAASGASTITTAKASSTIEATMAAIGKVPGVGAVATPAASQLISKDGTVGLGSVHYPDSAFAVTEDTKDGVAAAVAGARAQGLQVEFGGEVVPGVSQEAPSSELLGLGVAVIVLLIAFGSVMAMGLPIITALLGLGIGISGVGIMSAFVDLSSLGPDPRGDDRARRRHRLRAVHRDPPPRRTCAHGLTVEEAAGGPSPPRAARSSSPAPPSSSPSPGSPSSASRSSRSWASRRGRRRGRGVRRGHPAARAARLRRAQHRPLPRARASGTAPAAPQNARRCGTAGPLGDQRDRSPRWSPGSS